MRSSSVVLFSLAVALGAMGQAGAQSGKQQPWQRLQMPSIAALEKTWVTPPPEYGPEPYFGLNGKMDLDVVKHDLDVIQALGFRAVTAQFGSGNFGYLSPEYLGFFREFVAELKRRDMRLWIVDDAGYPSGFAGGRFSAEHPELRMQALVAQRIDANGHEVDVSAPAGTVAVTAISSAGETVQIPFDGGRIQWQPPAGEWTVYVVTHEFRTSPTRSDTNPKRTKDASQSLEDYLDPKATAQYLEFTHEAYKKAVGDEFGKTVLGFRGDEPDYSIGGLPWTPRLFETSTRVKGYDIRPYVAAFLQPKGVALTPKQLLAKADFYDVFAQMFRDGFFKPQAEWCAANGLEYQVHLNHEEAQLALTHSEGDFFRDMRYVQMPGVDTIWHQIWTDTISDFPRLASSAAHVYGHPRAMTESFAAYRPEPDIRLAKYILDEQFVRGINLVETMYVSSAALSSKGREGAPAFMRDPGYPGLMRYTGRLSYLLSMGRPMATVALLLPTASLWMNDAVADNTFVSAERLLSESQIDFDIVDEDAVASLLTMNAGKMQSLSGNAYRTILVPHASILSQEIVSRLRRFAEGGGRVVFLGDLPGQVSGKSYLEARAASPEDFRWAQVTRGEISATPTPPGFPPASAPEPLRVSPEMMRMVRESVSDAGLTLGQPDASLKFLRRQMKDGTVYFLFNESSKALKNEVTLKAVGHRVEQWDAETGSHHVLARGSARLPLEMQPYSTMVLVVR